MACSCCVTEEVWCVVMVIFVRIEHVCLAVLSHV